jgi:hypothetical protein
MPRPGTPYGIIPRPEFKITQEVLDTIRKEAERGLTISQVCAVLGIAPATYYDKKNKYPEIETQYQLGRGVALSKIENALFRNATEPAIGKDGAPIGPPAGNVDAQKFLLKTQAGYRENDAPTVLIQHNALFPPEAAPLVEAFLGGGVAIQQTNSATEPSS